MIIGASSTTTSAATDATTSKAAADQNKLSGDLNRFLTLLVTQLQNQDPLEPLDANQFTSQPVQFASVEQQINQNANLEKLLAAQASNGVASAIGYLGTTVEGEGEALPLQDGSAQASYTLGQSAAEAGAIVRDLAGKAVFSTEVDGAAGTHAFTWDGVASDGRTLADGTYSLEIVAKTRAGAAIPATQTWFGKVTGVGSGAAGAQLNIGDDSVLLADVLSVRESGTSRAVEGE
jgi:flagellar basal-body rod modification protein FlgD